MLVKDWIKAANKGEFDSADGLLKAGFAALNGENEESAMTRFTSSRKFLSKITNPAILNNFQLTCESAPNDVMAVNWNYKNPRMPNYRYDAYSFIHMGNSDADLDFHVTVGRAIFGWNQNARYVVRTGLYDGDESGKEIFTARTPYECVKFLNSSVLSVLAKAVK